jgi:hypothetical protein
MRIWRSLRLRMDGLFRRTKAEEDLSAEMQHYIECETERYVANGHSLKEARLLAQQGMEQAKEECRDARGSASPGIRLHTGRTFPESDQILCPAAFQNVPRTPLRHARSRRLYDQNNYDAVVVGCRPAKPHENRR